MPPLIAPEPPPPLPVPPPPPPRLAKAAGKPPPSPLSPLSWTEVVRRQLQDMKARDAFYPHEAIAAGLQGTAEVLIVIDPVGNVTAARLEGSSGYAILDQAALRAARALRSLPADAPREVVLPIVFRLH